MKILIAPDSFKDALPALAACEAISKGVLAARPGAAVRLCPMADGGDGTIDVLSYHLKGAIHQVQVHDPLFRTVEAAYFQFDEIAYIEMAKASGLELLGQEERNPLETSTFGTGELIMSAINKGAKRIYLAIGGSATNDGGMGMAAALGWQFLDKKYKPLKPTGLNLKEVSHIIPPKDDPINWLSHPITLLCDVVNPLYGPNGAAYVYGPQKGASPAMVQQLDEGLCHFAKIVEGVFGKNFAFKQGAGAAGGLGFGAMAFLGAEPKSGATAIMDLVDFDAQLSWADCVITGEGKLDAQSFQGKLIGQLCQRGKAMGVPVYGICGMVEANVQEMHEIGMELALELRRPEEPLMDALQRTPIALEEAAQRLFRSITG